MDPTYAAFFRFFGLRQNPFNVNPDPQYLFLNQRTQNVLNDLSSAISARKGLMVVTGDVGTGKTTLLNALIQRLKQQKTATAFIFNPHLQVSELFDLMLASFAIPAWYGMGGSSLLRLNQWLLDRYHCGANTVLIVDEAQGLPIHVLEEIRMLLNQETPHEKLLQIVLCGHPELEDKLKGVALRQFRQRISFRCRMTALTREEAHGYIQHRLRTAGAPNALIFMPEAVDTAHLYARGIPRVMNLLCEHALITAYLEQIRPVGPSMIEEVARQLQLDEVKPVSAPLVSLLGGDLSKPHSQPVNSIDAFLDDLKATSTPSSPLLHTVPTESATLAVSPPIQPMAFAAAASTSSANHSVSRFADYQEKSAQSLGPVPVEDPCSSRDPDSGLPFEPATPRSQVLQMSAALQPHPKKRSHSALPPFLHQWRVEATAALSKVDTAVLRGLSRIPQFKRLPQLQAIPEQFSRCASMLQRNLASLPWEKPKDDLLRWLRQPMFVTKEQRRARH